MPIWVDIVGWVSKGVFVILVILSVYSVSIILNRYRVLRENDDALLFEEFQKKVRSGNAVMAELSSLGTNYKGLRAESLALSLEMSKRPDKIDRAFNSWLSDTRGRLDKGLTTLATLGNNAPFIGLFGTVLGIIQAFGVLAHSQNSGSTTVMAAIAEALIATAIGLFVAIPAVVAFNYFNRWIKDILTDCEVMKDSIVSRWQ